MGNILESDNCQTVGWCGHENIAYQELKKYMLSDQQIGKIINLGEKAKIAFIDLLKSFKFQSNSSNELYPFDNNKIDGFLYYPRQYLYEGPINKKIMEGKGRVHYIKKECIYKGNFKNNLPQGNGKLTVMQHKMTFEGIWIKGYPSKVDFQSSKHKYIIKFANEQMAEGQIIFNDRSRYKGKFIFDASKKVYLAEGKGRFTHQNNNYLQGQFKNGYLQGKGVCHHISNKEYYEGQFKNGLFNGEGKYYFSNGSILTINWKENKPEGVGQYMINQTKIIVHYQQGQRLKLKHDEQFTSQI